MSSSPTNKDEIAPPEIKDPSLADNNIAPSLPEEEIPVLPVEVLRQTLDHLDNVVDLASVAMVCREWRELINSCDACWERSFYRDYSRYQARDSTKLPTWRKRYIACTLDKACLEIRDARRAVSALGEEIDYLELAVLKKYSSLAKAESEFKHFKKNPRLQDDIARDTEAIDENKRICDNEMDMLNKLELKRSSLQAAVNYTPKIDLFIEYYDFEGF